MSYLNFLLALAFGREVSPDEGITLSSLFLVFALVVMVFSIVVLALFSPIIESSPVISEGVSGFFVLIIVALIILGLLIPNWTVAQIRDAFLGLIFPQKKKEKKKRKKRGKKSKS